MSKLNFPKLIFSIFICQLAGIIGSLFTFSAIPTWYATLNKPTFSPPNWLFGTVWTTLYLLMGISLYRVWISKTKKKEKMEGVVFFIIQLVLNALWSILFFGMQNPALAFVEIIFMWLFIVVTIFRFEKVDKLAAYLLVPYLLWVSFASILNFSIWQLN